MVGPTRVWIPHTELPPTQTPQLIEGGFKALRTAYPTWSALRAYLTSEEGGALKVAFQNEHYALIHYVKGTSRMELPHVRLFRSVVWDIVDHLPVSVTAPKSETGESFPPPSSGDYVVTPFHDGVLVGAFHCKYTGQTLLHTRTYFGGGNTFYSKKTFGEMFAEAWRNEPSLSAPKEGQSFTYVLQHPENRVVTPVGRPRIICVHVAQVLSDGLVDSSPVWDAALPFHARSQDTPADILGCYRTHGALDQGLCFLSLAAPYKRFKIRNPTYNAIRLLRGNNASLDYTWLSLWRATTLHEYLKSYPEERARANALIQAWKTATGEVYHYYEDIFKRHTLTMAQAPPKYKPLLFQLHAQYKATRTPIAWAACKEFMNTRDLPQMLHILRWDARMGATTVAVANPALSAAQAAGTGTGTGAVIVLATSPPVAAAAVAVAEEEEEDYSDMPGLVPVDSLFPPPPEGGAVERIESGPVV
jgi:hypothetical protein